MRNARAQDYIRRLSDQAHLWPITVAEFSCVDVLGLGTQAITINSPVTVLCGPNGVGKSTLLNALWAAVDIASARKRELNQLKFDAGEVKVKINFRGEPRELSVNLVQDASDPVNALFSEVVHVDTSADVERLQKFWIAEKNAHFEVDETETVEAEEITEGEAVRELSSKEIDILNYITGRRYTKILVSEIELSSETVPFFEVALDATAYDSRTMGSGEFAAFLMWWKLDRTKDHALLLLEEPESFLSPNARDAFIKVLLHYAFNKKCARF